MNIDTSTLNKVKVTLFLSNLANFVLISYVVISWLIGLDVVTSVFLGCLVATLVVAWVPVVSVGFFMYFLHFIGVNDPLMFVCAALPTVVYLAVIATFPNRVVVQSKL